MAGNFFQQVKSAANQAVDSTKNATKKTMLKSKIQTENSNADKLYAEVGKYYYNIYKDNFPDELGQLFANINQVRGNIAALEKEYQDVEQMEQMANYNRQMQQQYQNRQSYNGMPQQQQQYQQPYNGMPQQQQQYQQSYNGTPQQQQQYQQSYNGMPQQEQQQQQQEQQQ